MCKDKTFFYFWEIIVRNVIVQITDKLKKQIFSKSQLVALHIIQKHRSQGPKVTQLYQSDRTHANSNWLFPNKIDKITNDKIFQRRLNKRKPGE